MTKIPWVELNFIALFCLSLMFLLDFFARSSSAATVKQQNGMETKPKDFWSAFMDRKKTKGSVPAPPPKQFNPGARTISSYGAPIPAVPKHSQDFVEEEEEEESEGEQEEEEEERGTWSDEYSSDEGLVSPVPGHSHHHEISPPSSEPKNRHQSEQKEVKKPVKKVTFDKNLDEKKGQWRDQLTPLREGDFWRDKVVIPERFRKAPMEPPTTKNNVVFESLHRDNSKKSPNFHDEKIEVEQKRKPVKTKNIPESVSADMRTKQIVQDNRQPAAFGKDQLHSEQQFFFPRPAPLILSLDDMPVWDAESMANYFGLSEFQREQQRLNEMRRHQEQQQINRGKGGKEVYPSLRSENNAPNRRTQNSLPHPAANRSVSHKAEPPPDRAEIPAANSCPFDNGKIQLKGVDKNREDPPFQKDVKRPTGKTNSPSSPPSNPHQPKSGPPEREIRDPIIDQIKMTVGFPEKPPVGQSACKTSEAGKNVQNEGAKTLPKNVQPHENIQIIKQQSVTKEPEPFLDPIIRQIQEAVSPKGERVCASVLSEEEEAKLRRDMSKKRANVFGQKRQNLEEVKNVKESVSDMGKHQSNVKFRNDRNLESISVKTKGSPLAAELHHQQENRPPKSTAKTNKQSIANTENRRKSEKQLQKVVPIPSTLKTPLSRDKEIGDSRSPSRNDEEDEEEEEDREMIWADTREYFSDNDSDYELTPSDDEGEENNEFHCSPTPQRISVKKEGSKVEPRSIKNVKPLPLSPTTVPSTPELFHYNDHQRPSSTSSYWAMLNPTKLLPDPTLYLPLLPSLPSIWGNRESAGENTRETSERSIKGSPIERKNGEFVDRAFVVARFHQLRSVPALAEYLDKGYRLLVRFRIGNSVFPKEGVPLKDYSRRTIKEPKKVVHYFRHSFSDTKILRRNGRATLTNKNPPGQFWNAMVDLFLKSYFSAANKSVDGKDDEEEPQLRLEIWVDLNSSRARYYSSYVWSYSPIRCLDLRAQAEHLETFQFVENVKVGLGYAFSITSKHPEKVLDDCKKKK